jgi:hypothetical protein
MFRHCHTSTWFVCITLQRDVPVNYRDPAQRSGAANRRSEPHGGRPGCAGQKGRHNLQAIPGLPPE